MPDIHHLRCGYCNKEGQHTPCACKTVAYCSAQCQKEHSVVHQASCTIHKLRKQIAQPSQAETVAELAAGYEGFGGRPAAAASALGQMAAASHHGGQVRLSKNAQDQLERASGPDLHGLVSQLMQLQLAQSTMQEVFEQCARRVKQDQSRQPQVAAGLGANQLLPHGLPQNLLAATGGLGMGVGAAGIGVGANLWMQPGGAESLMNAGGVAGFGGMPDAATFLTPGACGMSQVPKPAPPPQDAKPWSPPTGGTPGQPGSPGRGVAAKGESPSRDQGGLSQGLPAFFAQGQQGGVEMSLTQPLDGEGDGALEDMAQGAKMDWHVDRAPGAERGIDPVSAHVSAPSGGKDLVSRFEDKLKLADVRRSDAMEWSDADTREFCEMYLFERSEAQPIIEYLRKQRKADAGA
eukprot:TRINITY_DN39847_c0_g1_i1.p1 TRINITY_DN39847_c0_g1~~TRINITY_DN39847_c0_g1_i1.p1  ORF type:complete len:406 (+),score=67.71 TRINITY_DN39847_c0_g1_i1:55-1272(+)